MFALLLVFVVPRPCLSESESNLSARLRNSQKIPDTGGAVWQEDWLSVYKTQPQWKRDAGEGGGGDGRGGTKEEEEGESQEATGTSSLVGWAPSLLGDGFADRWNKIFLS
jgi:hypothetical protein